MSTNVKYPTFAKRLRQSLENFLPEQIDHILNKSYIYHTQIKGILSKKLKL